MFKVLCQSPQVLCAAHLVAVKVAIVPQTANYLYLFSTEPSSALNIPKIARFAPPTNLFNLAFSICSVLPSRNDFLATQKKGAFPPIPLNNQRSKVVIFCEPCKPYTHTFLFTFRMLFSC